MDEDAVQTLRSQVKGIGANLSAIIERSKATERDNRTLRLRLAELEARFSTAAAVPSSMDIKEKEKDKESRKNKDKEKESRKEKDKVKGKEKDRDRDRQTGKTAAVIVKRVHAGTQTNVKHTVVRRESISEQGQNSNGGYEDNEGSTETTIENNSTETDKLRKWTGRHTRLPTLSPSHRRNHTLSALVTPSAQPTTSNSPSDSLSSSYCQSNTEGNNRPFANALWYVLVSRQRASAPTPVCPLVLCRLPIGPSDHRAGLGFFVGEIVARALA